MFKKLFPTSIILMATVLISCTESAPNIKEGLWEIITKMTIQGMEMPPMIHAQCITKNDLVPKGSEQPGQECEITDVKLNGDTVTWTMTCTGQDGNIKGTGEIKYSGERFNGTMKISMPQNMEMSSHLRGERIGDCK